ncbi:MULTISPECIES: VIT1/CCC1 family protein [unclassified Pseudonocardia]|uniref:VIT1/CCC1 transporter family protein n=1 Tax=unclassified Pseudonocardia TaxID=2619320 RepID=UPI0025FC6046|nr:MULTISPECIES: VIT1/CCC1 family protein [unclassified Pseudonocardia]
MTVDRMPGAGGAPSKASVRRWRRMLADERAESRLYRDLAERRTGEDRAILLGLAQAEERHAAHWERMLGPDVGRIPRPGPRSRVLAVLARRFGSVFVLALAQRAESRSPYATDPEATATMAADERIHEEVLRGLAARGRARVSGTFRAAVFGANDGLVSNLALVLGVSGGGATARTVLLTGIAGLLAGALSMGAGEYVSVRSQRELLEVSAPELSDAPQVLPHLDIDENELALVMRARGLSEDEAVVRSREMLRTFDPAVGLRGGGTGADDEHETIGTALAAASSSFAFFASGAAIPILPFVFGGSGAIAYVVSAVLVGLALLATGAIVGLLSGGPPLRRGLRQLLIGAVAAGVTYGLGLLFGTVLG